MGLFTFLVRALFPKRLAKSVINILTHTKEFLPLLLFPPATGTHFFMLLFNDAVNDFLKLHLSLIGVAISQIHVVSIYFNSPHQLFLKGKENPLVG